MEVIPQQAVSKRVGNLGNIFGVELEKVGVVPVFDEDVGPVDATVIDMIVVTGFKGNYGWHLLSLILAQTDAVSKTASV